MGLLEDDQRLEDTTSMFRDERSHGVVHVAGDAQVPEWTCVGADDDGAVR